MKKIKQYIKPLGLVFLILLLYALVFSSLNYWGIISSSLFEKINFIITIIFSLIFGIHIGKRAEKKGYLMGLKYGTILLFVLLLLNIIFIRRLSFETISYYLVLPLVITTGSILGINLKNKKK